MKIAAKLFVTALTTVLVFGSDAQHVAKAETVAVTLEATPPAVAPSAVPGPITPATLEASPKAADSTQVKEVLDSIKVPSSDDAFAKVHKTSQKADKADKADDDDKRETPFPSPKVPDSVKKAVNKLSNATDDVTLDNLNTAREAVVKLDVLIDIEKRLNDLAKLRKDRADKEEIATAIPSSALQPPPLTITPTGVISYQPQQPAVPAVTPSVLAMPAKVEVLRISGASGHYTAQIKEMDGAPKRVNVGDKLLDGSTVNAISRQGVTLTSNNKNRTIQVKDINTVFGGR